MITVSRLALTERTQERVRRGHPGRAGATRAAQAQEVPHLIIASTSRDVATTKN